MQQRELIIIGGGPAGIAAAVSARKAGIKDILILERDQFLGGILNQCIHTGFGLKHYEEILTGPEYAGRAIKELNDLDGIEISLKSFVVELTGDRKITYLRPGKMETVQARAVILATGCRERTREMVHIPGTRPAGIFPAGLAQKMINMEGLLPGKEVVIVGSGDIGLIMARRFTLEGAKVKCVVEIESKSRGLTRNIVQCLEDFDIPLYLNHRVSRISGRDRVEEVEIEAVHPITGSQVPGPRPPATKFKVSCDTVLMSVGLIPENELLEMAGGVVDKRTNTPVSEGLNRTSVPGVFACGNAYKVYDIVDSVTRDSIEAGKLAAEYLNKQSVFANEVKQTRI